MKEVFLVSKENKNKALDKLKNDDRISRGSIVLREAKALGIEENGFFLAIDCDEHDVKRAIEILKDLAHVYKHKEKVLEKIEEQEENAIQGFGNILGF